MSRRLAVLAGTCALLVAGCGGDSEREAAPPAAAGGGDEQAIRDTLQRYAAAVRAGDAEKICTELLAPAVLERVEAVGGDCARDLMADRIAEAGPDYALTVRSIQLEGNRATAKTEAVESDGRRAATQPLVRVAGGWRLAP